ncbi:MAG TPA: zinc dependent phospholipase C family protein [Acidobacteriaceae bacterium]|nr:zinc dependent phospholipase C family protein [Acidobacteriaceae bacterium]
MLYIKRTAQQGIRTGYPGDICPARNPGHRWFRHAVLVLIALLLVSASTPQSHAYSFLSHEDMIDASWNGSIRPLLRKRFPGASEAQLREARSYAYGGATIQDMGYYPFGHQYFSNLTHYVRSGDFVTNLLLNANTVDEYAFALGALAHYVGDNEGHQFATNPSTAVEFPVLERRYGPIVTYDQAPNAHVRTEFAFDIEQLSQHRFAPAGYLHSVGFRVPRDLLERTFAQTYGLSLRSVLGRPKPALKSYDASVGKLLPDVAQAEVMVYGHNFPPDQNTPAFHVFQQRQSRSRVENGWQKWKPKQGFKVHAIAFIIRMVRIGPKVGPLSALAIKGPNVETERWYIESMNRSMAEYEQLLDKLAKNPRKELPLADRDLDTGHEIRLGSYPLTDQTYAKLLRQLTAQPARPVPVRLQQNILKFYAAAPAQPPPKTNKNAWKRTQAELPILRDMQTIGSPAK